MFSFVLVMIVLHFHHRKEVLIHIRLLNRTVCHGKTDFLIKWIIIRLFEYGPSKHNERRLIVRGGKQDFVLLSEDSSR